MSLCPRCRKPLEEHQLDLLRMQICHECQGLSIGHRDLVEVIESSWRKVSPEAAESLSFHGSSRDEGVGAFPCPSCSKPMERYGYMGLRAVEIDRCDACEQVWLDADELQNMVLALAKEKLRSAKEHKKRKQEEIPLPTPMPATAYTRHTNWLFGDDERSFGSGKWVAAQMLLGRMFRR
jgi:Zn-finger nucleic acid-binding protein